MKSAPQEYSVSVSETDNPLQLTPPNLKGSEFWYFQLIPGIPFEDEIS